MDLGPSGGDRRFGEVGRQDDVQASVPGMEVTDLAVSEECVLGCHWHVVAQPDRPLRGVGDGSRSLLDVGEAKDERCQCRAHVLGGVLVQLDVRGPRRGPGLWPGALRESELAHLDLLLSVQLLMAGEARR